MVDSVSTKAPAMDVRQPIHSDHAKTLDTAGLRQQFLVDRVFVPGELTLTYSQIDRIIVGGAMPLASELGFTPELAKQFAVGAFLERRELGLINVGGPGTVVVDGATYEIGPREALYVGMGARDVRFRSADAANARQVLPQQRAGASRAADAQGHAGPGLARHARRCEDGESAHDLQVPGARRGRDLPAHDGHDRARAGQRVEHVPHAHARARMEVYFYFALPEDAAVFHLCGRPDETRHLVVRNEQAVISPSWSIHSGVGTQAYTFIWGMVGENQVFDDMDHVATRALR